MDSFWTTSILAILLFAKPSLHQPLSLLRELDIVLETDSDLSYVTFMFIERMLILFIVTVFNELSNFQADLVPHNFTFFPMVFNRHN